MQHTQAIADRLAATAGHAEHEEFPLLIYSSPFRRCAHTAHVIAKTLQIAAKTQEEQELVAVRIEDGLTEWLTPSLVVNQETGERTFPKTPQQLVEEYGFDTIDLSYRSVNPSFDTLGEEKKDQDSDEDSDVVPGLDDSTPGYISPAFPESENRLLLRAKTTLDNIVDALVEETVESGIFSKPPSLVIVSHAPCLQALAYNLLGGGDSAAEQMKPWPLGGITVFSRLVGVDDIDGEDDDKPIAGEEEFEWKLESYGDANHMPQVYKDGLKAWSLPGFTK